MIANDCPAGGRGGLIGRDIETRAAAFEEWTHVIGCQHSRDFFDLSLQKFVLAQIIGVPVIGDAQQRPAVADLIDRIGWPLAWAEDKKAPPINPSAPKSLLFMPKSSITCAFDSVPTKGVKCSPSKNIEVDPEI